MRRFMPSEHRAFPERVETMPPIRDHINKALSHEALEALATFREAHLNFAQEYIARWVDDPRGTGGTPYLEWLGQLIAETRGCKVPLIATQPRPSEPDRDPTGRRPESIF